VKAHFKYSFLSTLRERGIVFVAIFAMNFVFIVLGSLGLLPFPAQVVAVSLAGTAIAVMAIVNIVFDIGMIRRMFSSTRAYPTALVPASRYKMLLSNVVVMAIVDIVTMAVVIVGQIWLALLLAGYYMVPTEFVRDVVDMAYIFSGDVVTSFVRGFLMLISGYLLLIMFIISCIIVRKSIFYQKRAGGLLTALVAIGAYYVYTLSYFALAPFGTVARYGWQGMFIEITPGRAGFIPLIVLTFIQVALLFIISSKLMERKLNI
jgi:hypothetical protein